MLQKVKIKSQEVVIKTTSCDKNKPKIGKMQGVKYKLFINILLLAKKNEKYLHGSLLTKGIW